MPERTYRTAATLALEFEGGRTLRVDGFEAVLTPRQAAVPIWQEVLRRVPPFDDAGCDWYTDGRGRTYIAGDPEWKVSDDPAVAALVDAANLIALGHTMKMEAAHV
jgi:hypothetical protein